jgi:hypothetical protein
MTKTHGENKRELHTGEFSDIVHNCNINDITCEEGNIDGSVVERNPYANYQSKAI